LHRRLAVLRLGYDLDVLGGLQQQLESHAHDRMIVGEENPDAAHLPVSAGAVSAAAGSIEVGASARSGCTWRRGKRAVTSSPPPGASSSARLPPMAVARSCMPISP